MTFDSVHGNQKSYRSADEFDAPEGNGSSGTNSGWNVRYDDLYPIMYEADLVHQPQIRWLLEDLIPEDSLVVGWGASQACKSFLLLDIGLHMTHAIDWHGRKVQPGAVAYIVAEGERGIGKRVRGWKRHYKIDHTHSPFVTIPTAVNLMDEAQVEKLIWQLKEIEREHGFKFAFIVIDTLAKCMVGGDENATRDMVIAVRHADRIREALGGATVALVHHCGKDLEKGPRGSYALYAGVNASIYVERTKEDGEDFITLQLGKQKDDDDGVAPIRFNLTKVWLPLRPGDDPLKPESTLVLDKFEMQAERAMPHPEDGHKIDPRYADLVSIASWLTDGAQTSVSVLAKGRFGHERHCQRVRDAVPFDWTEVETPNGIRYLRQITKTIKGGGLRHFIECRSYA